MSIENQDRLKVEEALQLARTLRTALTNGSVSLENAIQEFYTIAQILQRKDDLAWAKKEIQGYNKSDKYPEYRARVTRTFYAHGKQIRELVNDSKINNYHCYYSITEIERVLKIKSSEQPFVTMSDENYQKFKTEYPQFADPSLKWRFYPDSLTRILSSVKLELKRRLTDIISLPITPDVDKKISEDNNENLQFEQISSKPDLIIENIFNRFHEVAKQLQIRRENRQTLKINDEYDVQDLLRALLKLYFDDIRTEEPNPSNAGSSSKVDFLIIDHSIFIECKKTRTGLGTREAKKQLIMDKEDYKKNPNCKVLYCLIYDPDELIDNPRGFEKDLSEHIDKFECKVFVIP